MSITKTTTKRDITKRQRRPSHPGALLRNVVLPEAGITQTALADRMGVSWRTINMILNEQRSITPDIAHRLGRVFGNGPELWLNMQRAVDVWDALQAHGEEYRNIEPLEQVA